MSTMTRSSATKSKSKKKGVTPSAPLRARMTRETEAPDRGAEIIEREAPETGRVRIAEAPDAGEGRLGLIEHEFTHGRSQS